MSGVVCTPLRSEWWAVKDRMQAPVVRTGRGPSGGYDRGSSPSGPLLVAGVAGALADGPRAGDLVVADEVRGDGALHASHAAPFLAGALRSVGLTVHRGPIVSSPSVVNAPDARAALAVDGSLAVDTESAWLGAGVPEGMLSVVRAIVDTPADRLLSPGTAWRGMQALRSLRRAAPVLDAWAAAVGDREVVLAGPRSFCAGVERAIQIVENAIDRFGAPVYVRRQIVHNTHVVSDLERRGAIFVQEVGEVPEGSVAVLAAHGVAPTVRVEAAERQLQVIDATCPLVTKVHSEVRRFADRDHTVFLIGHHEHEEVVGTRGEAPDDVVVVADVDEARRVTVPNPEKVAYVMQTTLSVEEAEETAAALRQRFPALSAPRKDDICYATSNRQLAVRTVARETDLVIVVGSQNSSNSLRLAEVAESEGVPAHLVEDAESVDLRWLEGVSRIGVTAGASAPPHLVDELVRGLTGLGDVRVSHRDVVDENVRFTLPKEVG